MKKIFGIIGVILLICFFVVAAFVGYLTIDEYKPDDIEALEIAGTATKEMEQGKDFTVMTWNVGYGALGDNADFFMDGGKSVYSSDKVRVDQNITTISNTVTEINPDILYLQETDRKSSRSYFIDELEEIRARSDAAVSNGQYSFAANFKVAYVPLPVPPIGKVHAGLGFLSDVKVDSAERYSLPCPFKWPLRIMNLKRCLQIMRAPVKDSDKELVMINLHLEAYDEGEGKIAQTNMLKEIMRAEIDKGNYVIVAGDFNQTFSNVDVSMYPLLDGMWEPGTIDVTEFGNDISFVADNSVPTCRSLDRPLTTAKDTDPQHFQYYMLDGFIVSSNVEMKEIHTIDLGFESSDHNPIVMKFSLSK